MAGIVAALGCFLEKNMQHCRLFSADTTDVAHSKGFSLGPKNRLIYLYVYAKNPKLLFNAFPDR
jgi:hypothetical protein